MREDLRAATRFLRRRPGVSALVVATLAIGIAATTIVFSMADAILWHPLPFRSASRLVKIRATSGKASAVNPLASLIAADHPSDNPAFDGIFPFALDSAIVSVGGDPRAVTIAELSPGLLVALNVRPGWGREFTRNEYTPGSSAVLVSAELWSRIQAASPVSTEPVLVSDGVRQTIVGVMPRDFEFPVSRVSVWRPHVLTSASTHVTAVGLLKPGVTLEQARAFARTLTATASQTSQGVVQVVPFASVPASTATALRVLLGAVAMLLLIAIANAANVLLADAVRRDSEMAIRVCLGASPWRLIRQTVAEALALSTIAAVVALVVSQWALDVLVSAVPYLMSFQVLRPIHLDWRGLWFAAAAATLAGCAASWFSVIRAARIDTQEALRGQASGLRAQTRSRAVLTVSQIAITSVLLTSAGLLGNSFLRLSIVDPGFNPARLVELVVQLPTWRYPTESQKRSALGLLRAEAARTPGVISVTVANAIPPNLQSRSLQGLETAGSDQQSVEGSVSLARVDDAFFSTLGIPVLSGRAFNGHDRLGGLPVAVVSRALAERVWTQGNPLGQRFRESPTEPWRTVVGVVGNVRNGSFEQTVGPMAYYTPRAQEAETWWYEGLIVRTAAEPEAILPALRSIVRRTMPDAPVIDLLTGYDAVASGNARVRFSTRLMLALAGTALTLALVGIYGTCWYSVRQRSREIGVRMALGAKRSDVLRMVLGAGARLTCYGLALGVPLAVVAARALKSLLFEVSPGDPLVFAAMGLFLAVSSLAATYLPARRAASIDPIRTLRHQ